MADVLTPERLKALAACSVPERDEDGCHEYACSLCGVEYYLDEPDIQEPSALCDDCAHEVTDVDLPALIAMVRALESQIEADRADYDESRKLLYRQAREFEERAKQAESQLVAAREEAKSG